MKSKMEHFNKMVNSDANFTYHSEEFSMYRVKFARTYERMIEISLLHPETPYRLFILYKETHRVKKLAGRCFWWNGLEWTRNGVDVESEKQGFGEPRFDGVDAAIFITDESVVAFGNVRFFSARIDLGCKYVYCDVYLGERISSYVKIPVEVFNRIVAQGWVKK